jgi:putative flippase GtrA
MLPPITQSRHKLGNVNLVVRYATFAAIATVANIAAQRLIFATIDQEIRFLLALVAGTGVGLVLKYILDKKWIFFDAMRPLAAESRKFTFYTLTGIGTTLIFWGSEALFWVLWHTQSMRETGAILGLTIGYIIKYNLDRRYVFRI